ncbi:extracellular calcium-sensing receptor-like [Protopterus annectens]|uniref:extracellular calcium-sensing receptor-like n=1 Tax=Protopterus annectens TaxID=7888 RepID=UPI001CFBAD9F|nr:extracellular calcium-sensing receptor-like [Protopterus annectens]
MLTPLLSDTVLLPSFVRTVLNADFHGAGLPLLSDTVLLPSFVRTVLNADFQVDGLAHLMMHFSWKWIGILASDNDIGLQGSQQLKKELHNVGICVAFHEILPTNIPQYKAQLLVETIKKSSASIVIFYAFESQVASIMREALNQNVYGKVWIGTIGWVTSAFSSDIDIWKTLHGTLGFAIYSGDIIGFKEYLFSIHPFKYPNDIYMKFFWEAAFGCKWLANGSLYRSADNEQRNRPTFCTGTEALELLDPSVYQVNEFRFTYSMYNAVYSLAVALSNLQSCTTGKGPFFNSTCTEWKDFVPWQVPQSVCSDSCPLGYRQAIRQGQPHCCHDCVPCPEGEIANHTDSVECFRCNRDQWTNEKQDVCLPKQVEFLSYDEHLGKALAVISIIFSLIPVYILGLFVKHRETPIVKANNCELSYLLLFSLVLCFLCSLIFIGYPLRGTCLLRQTAFGITFASCVSCVLAKTVTVVIAFSATKPGSKLQQWVGFKLPATIIICCTLLQVIICIVWLALSPPYPDFNTSAKIGILIIECNEGSAIAFWCMLGYMGLLASVSFVVAFLARNLPDSFNETRFITFSLLVFVSVWLSFVPAYLSTRGKYMIAVEIFAILSSGMGLLTCIFFPKCYIVLLRPEINTKEYLMGRSNARKTERNHVNG